jgi:hypothetical protein
MDVIAITGDGTFDATLGEDDSLTIQPQSYAVQVHVAGRWEGPSGIRLGSDDEAADYGLDLFTRWTLPDDYRVIPSTDPVNYRYVDGELERCS